jgi:hypothetical protein
MRIGQWQVAQLPELQEAHLDPPDETCPDSPFTRVAQTDMIRRAPRDPHLTQSSFLPFSPIRQSCSNTLLHLLQRNS